MLYSCQTVAVFYFQWSTDYYLLDCFLFICCCFFQIGFFKVLRLVWLHGGDLETVSIKVWHMRGGVLVVNLGHIEERMNILIVR